MQPADTTPNRALFLDRDGVINVDIGYLNRAEDCCFVDGIFELAGAFAARGFLIIIATNQAGIGRGHYAEAEFVVLMDWMRGEFSSRRVDVAAVYHCPDHPTAGIGRYRRENSWRKPGPGMFLQAAADFALDMAHCWCVGDKPTDIEAGRAAGIGHLVRYAPDAPERMRIEDHWVVRDLRDVMILL